MPRSLGFVVARLVLIILACSLGALGCAADVGDQGSASASAATEGAGAKDAAAALKEAIEKKEAVDARLGRATTRVGAMLTADQSRAFVQAFRQLPDVVAADTAYQQAATALAEELERIDGDDAELAGVMRGIRNGWGFVSYGPREHFDAHALLAQTAFPIPALKFAVRLLEGDERLAAIDASLEEVVDELLVPALPSAFLAELLTTKSSSLAAERIKEILGQQRGALKNVTMWLNHIDDIVMKGQPLVVTSVTVSGRDVGKALAAIGGILTIWELGVDLTQQDLEAAAANIVMNGPGAIGGLASATALYRRVVLGIEATPWADRIATIAGRVGAGVALVTKVFSLAENLGSWNEGVDDKIRVVADVVAIGASVLVLVGSGPVGPILATVAMGINLLADWLENRALAAQERQDLLACLPATGLSASMIDIMMAANPAQVRALAEDVKLTPEQIQWLISVDEWTVTEHPLAAGAIRFRGLVTAQEVFDLDGAETEALLRAVYGTETQAERKRYMVDQFLRAMEFLPGWHAGLTKREALAWLDQQKSGTFVPSDPEVRGAWTAAFTNARAYLATR